jgi:hypothetical protein
VRFYICLGGVFLGFLLSVVPVHAQMLRDQLIKPLPKIELLPAAEFEKKTKKIEKISETDPLISYEIRIPQDWTMLPDSKAAEPISPGEILGKIGSFVGPTGMDVPSFIQVHAISLDYQTTIEHWFLQHLIKGGYNVRGLKIYDDTCAEALFVDLKDAISYAVRSVACINGKRVIFIEYYLPLDNWEAEKTMQAQVLNSFRLKKMVRQYVEEFSETKLLDIVTIKFPKSWKLNPFPLRSIERMKAQLLNLATFTKEYDLKSKLDGKIDIDLVSVNAAQTLEQEIELLQKALQTDGLVIGESIEKSVDLVANPLFEFADTNVYKLADGNNKLRDYELWITAILSGEYYYFVSLVTPGRDQDYGVWARNTQAYKLIMDVMAPDLNYTTGAAAPSQPTKSTP